MKNFDPDDSYFSEDSSELEKDEIKEWQSESHYMRNNQGSLMNKEEAKLMNSGYETRETKKAYHRLRCDKPIP